VDRAVGRRNREGVIRHDRGSGRLLSRRRPDRLIGRTRQDKGEQRNCPPASTTHLAPLSLRQ
jgi:hypothetical protein